MRSYLFIFLRPAFIFRSIVSLEGTILFGGQSILLAKQLQAGFFLATSLDFKICWRISMYRLYYLTCRKALVSIYIYLKQATVEDYETE